MIGRNVNISTPDSPALRAREQCAVPSDRLMFNQGARLANPTDYAVFRHWRSTWQPSRYQLVKSQPKKQGGAGVSVLRGRGQKSATATSPIGMPLPIFLFFGDENGEKCKLRGHRAA